MVTCMSFSLYIVAFFSFGGVNSVGIKRRLAQLEGEGMAGSSDDPSAAAASAAGDGAEPSRLRGGIRQRLRAAEAATPPEPAIEHGDPGDKGPLTKRLIRKWAEGKLSAKEVQEFAFDAERQGAADLQSMSKMGSYGEHPQNCYRALKNALGLPSGSPGFAWFEIPTTFGARTPHPFLLPHEFFRSYYIAEKEKFFETMAGGKDAALQFWQSMRSSEFIKHHPEMPKITWGSTVPLGMHGDAASFSKQDGVYTFSWNSLIGSGTTVQKRFVATLIKKSNMVPGTMQAITKILSWSFNVMLSGETPRLDWNESPVEGGGLPLAGGWRAALCQVRGDWQFYCELFGFPQWNSADNMCWLCRASSTNPALAWVRYAADAGWGKTRWDHESYMKYLRAAGFLIPALLAVAIGFRLDCIMIDVLHTVDQGVASHIIANVMWVFAVVRKVFGGKTQEENVQRLYANMQKWYKGLKSKTRMQGKLTVERLRTKGGWPKLKAKAAATRHLAAYALHLAQTFGTGTVEDKQILGVCQMLSEFYNVMQSESQFLSAAAKLDVPKVGYRLVALYTALATDAKRKGLKLWKLQPKLHLFLHLCEWQAITHGNPRYYWTYADEDLMGIMAEIASSCHPRTMAMSALFKWLHLSFTV